MDEKRKALRKSNLLKIILEAELEYQKLPNDKNEYRLLKMYNDFEEEYGALPFTIGFYP